MIEVEYMLVNERTPAKLRETINMLLAARVGWTVHGEPIVRETTPGFNPEFYQAMIRREERPWRAGQKVKP